MKRFFTLGLLFVACTVLANSSSKENTVALVEKVAAFMKEKGKAETIKRINGKHPDMIPSGANVESDDRPYVAMRDLRTGMTLAHSEIPQMVGVNLVDVPDPNGRLYRRESLELATAKGQGWVDYLGKSRSSGKVHPRSLYSMRVGDVVLESSIAK